MIICFTFASQPTVAYRDSHMPTLSQCASLLTALTSAGFQQYATGLTSTADWVALNAASSLRRAVSTAQGTKRRRQCEQEAMAEETQSCGCQGRQGLLYSWGSPGQGPVLWTLMLLPLGESCSMIPLEHLKGTHVSADG